MAIIPSSMTSRRVGGWLPRWLRRQQEDQELARWTTELGWQWLDAIDSAQLARHSNTASRLPVTVAPQMHSVDIGPPVTLLVEMLPGQMVADFEAKADRIAAGMGVSKVHIEPYDAGWIKVVLLDDNRASTDVPVPA
jgi:hypothetical protein